MKKFLVIFFLGQLLILSYIFNSSIYDIYELNNVGDTSLKPYIIEKATGNNLSKFYDEAYEKYLKQNGNKLQVIKTPISKDNQFIYDIYHTNNEEINKNKSISEDKVYKYFSLKKEDFVDSTGVFYTDISSSEIRKISEEIKIPIKPYENNKVSYMQIIKYNLLNFIILVVLTQLVLFLYTFTRIKINAIKKVLGYSASKMIAHSVKEFLLLELYILITTLGVHFAYYTFKGSFVLRYYELLLIFSVAMIALNVIMLMVTQISIKFIDISSMIKNKIYSSGLNYSVHFIKVILILSVTLSISLFINNSIEHKDSLKALDKYRILDKFYTSNGFNSDEFEKAQKNPELFKKYGEEIKNIYDFYADKDKLFIRDSSITELLSSNYLEMNTTTREEVLSSIEKNNVVVNSNYINRFLKLKDINNNIISVSENNREPLLFVPEKYKNKESDIKKIYIEKYNDLFNYNEMYGLEVKNKRNIKDVSITYIKDNQEYELLGTTREDENTILKDSIVLVDQGEFGSLYYYDLLTKADFIFEVDDREEFSKVLYNHGLNKLVNVGTLLTPFMTQIHNTQFLMYNSMIFTLLFIISLVFIIYISNYIEVMCNRKKYAIEYILGFGYFKIFKHNMLISVLLMSMMVIKFFIDLNILVYLSAVALDFILLVYFYNVLIKKDLYKIEKGG